MPHPHTVSRAGAVLVIVAWLAVAALGAVIVPAESAEVREMFAFSQIMPILIGAFYFGQAGGLLVAFLASLVSGALVVLNGAAVDSLAMQRVMFHIIAFNSVALLTSFLSYQEKRRHRQVLHQLERLTALRAIDSSIIAGAPPVDTLTLLLERLVQLLRVNAAAVRLRDRATGELTVVATGGAAAGPPDGADTRAQQAMREGRTVVHVAPPAAAYYTLPLIAHGEAQGVLEARSRNPHRDHDWLEYLETLAGQAAIAVAHARLLDDLQRANRELSVAYEETLRGWARALDMRDRETEGHTQRVVTMGVALAERFGIEGERLVNFRRGAELHDIGKMGVPDQILLKPGPLNEEEWAVMRQHPVFAHKLLEPIPYLRPALVIPWLHHERWDGSGYPNGLRSTDIPLEARIFAVVDVWDALRSDRPYRGARPVDECAQYLREQSGKLFDPDVVAKFLKMRGQFA
jgi:response regulator RpfG family c-di-GMP phosphodiesterase